MTTDQVNEVQTTEEAEANGHAAVKPGVVSPRRTRKAKAQDAEPGTSVLEQLRELQQRAEDLKDKAVNELQSMRLILLNKLRDTEAELEELGVTVQSFPSAAPKAARPRKPTLPKAAPQRAAKPRGARLKRRSKDDIAAAAAEVAKLVKLASKDGLTAESIKSSLKIDKREWAAIAKYAVEEKLVHTKGRKRATTYHAK